MPIWIADYVLMEYGTERIMAVPDMTSATLSSRSASSCPLCVVVADQTADTPLGSEAYTDDTGGRLVNSAQLDGLSVQEAGARSRRGWPSVSMDRPW